MRRRTIHAWLSALIFVGVGACTREELGRPRTPVSVTSPNGRFVAFVRNHPALDPPSQSIWLGAMGASAAKLKTLGPDSDWCNTIVWSADSSTVSYLVQDARLIAADARTVRIISEQWLTDWKGEYPPHRMVQDLSLSSTGNEARFRDCNRHEASACGLFRIVAIRQILQLP